MHTDHGPMNAGATFYEWGLRGTIEYNGQLAFRTVILEDDEAPFAAEFAWHKNEYLRSRGMTPDVVVVRRRLTVGEWESGTP